MKYLSLCFYLSGCLAALAQANNPTTPTSTSVAVSPYSITQSGPHHRLWQRVTAQTNRAGNIISRTNAYTQLGTGLNRWNGEQWVPASDQIQLTQNGAAATNTQHQVAFAANLNIAGAINLTTPDGQQMASHVLGLAYYDPEASNNVLFAETQDSIGQLLASGNQVIYTNAFANLNCDVLYRQKLAGFEQDILIRQQLPSPAACGLTGSNIWLQVWTEFTVAPSPHITQQKSSSDPLLDFGIMRMGRGKAFMLGSPTNAVPVVKEWVSSQGRTFLVESVLLNSIATQMAQLPTPSGSSGNSNSISGPNNGGQSKIHYAHPSLASLAPPHPNFKTLKLPPPQLAKHTSASMRLAGADSSPKGLVLDYNLVNLSLTNITFQSDTTYYVSNEVDISGTATIEGGTVLKFDGSLDFYGPVNCLTSSYRPAVLTSANDDTVGEIIPGGASGPGLTMDQGDDEYLSGLRFVGGFYPLVINSLTSLHVQDCQFVGCSRAISPRADGCDLYLFNDLFAGDAVYCNGNGALTITAEQTTFGQGIFFDWDDGTCPTSVALTNCLFIDGPSQWEYLSYIQGQLVPGGGSAGGTYSATATYETNGNPFQTVGGGNYYLADNTYRGLGTSSIDPGLLADIQNKTTWPPIVYSNSTLTSPLVLSPQTPRDTNSSPDIGYHYDCIDYAMGGVSLNCSNVGVYPGTVIATFGIPYAAFGINAGSDVDFLCQGLATNWNRIVAYNTVQEQSGNPWLTPTNGMITDLLNYNIHILVQPTEINCRFTDWSVLAMDAPHIAITNEAPLFLRDCQLHGGTLLLNYYPYSSGTSSIKTRDSSSFAAVNTTFTPTDPSINNCLLERVNTFLDISDGSITDIENSLFFGGTFNFTPASAAATVQNNLFDDTCIPDNSLDSGSYTNGYNAYVTNCNRLQPTSTFDIILTNEPVYDVGPLGNYYLDSTADSPLINAGSTNASLLGLYDYTVLTNMCDGREMKETNGIVSISYHYVAMDSCGNPLSTYTNGLPDYLVTSSTDVISNWWEFIYFGNLDQGTNGNYNGDGTNNLYKYLNGIDPNIISFSISVPSQFVDTNVVSVSISVLGGVPANIAALVDSTNFISATWTSYTPSNIIVTLPTNQGPHDIWVGLRGLPTNAFQTWEETTVVLDSVPPAITITNPANNISVNSSRINICGNFVCGSPQQLTVNGVLAFINGTNFEVLNVPLSASTNSITAIIQDYDGDTNIASIAIVGLTNSDGSMNDPLDLQASPVGGFYPLPVTIQVQTNYPGTLGNVYYDFNGDDIADFTTNNFSSLIYTYSTNGEFFPVITVQTSVGRFSSIGGWNATSVYTTNQYVRISVEDSPVLVTNLSITDPVDIKWTASSNLYVLSGSTATITEYDTNGTIVASLSGIGSNPSGLDVDTNGNVYVAMTGSNQVWRFYPTNSTFAVDTTFGTNGCIGLTNGASGTSAGQFNAPYDVAISPDGGTISVSDSGNNRIQQFDSNGAFLSTFGTSGSSIGQFSTPKGLCYDSVGNLYIADSGNNRFALAQSSDVLSVNGTNGTGLLQFNAPGNVSVCERAVYVVDTGNNRIESFSPLQNGVYSFDLTDVRFGFSTNFSGPYAVAAVDNLTNEMFYVADTGNNQVALYRVPGEDPTPAWNNLTNNLVAGNLTAAVSSVCTDSADDYRQAFLTVGTNNVVTDINRIGTLTPVSVKNYTAEYYFEQTIDGQLLLFPVEFVKENGVWKILEF